MEANGLPPVAQCLDLSVCALKHGCFMLEVVGTILLVLLKSGQRHCCGTLNTIHPVGGPSNK